MQTPKKLILALLLPLLTYGQSDVDLAKKTIADLKKQSPTHDGLALNSYSIQDLNNDGVYEIIETLNRIEEEFTGFLNNELSPAFSFDKIYVLTDKKYIKSDSDLNNYLKNKIEHYELWKKLIQNPQVLTSDSQELIKANKDLFLTEIDRIIQSIADK